MVMNKKQKYNKPKNEVYKAYLTLNGRIFKEVLLDKESKMFTELVNAQYNNSDG